MPKINDKLIFGLLFICMALLNLAGIIKLSEQAILSYTIAALLISISSMFDGIASDFFYIPGLASMIILPWLCEPMFKFVFNSLDPNSILALGVGVSFFCIYLNKLKEETNVADLEKRTKEIEKEVWNEVKQVYEEEAKKDGNISGEGQ